MASIKRFMPKYSIVFRFKKTSPYVQIDRVSTPKRAKAISSYLKNRGAQVKIVKM